MNIRIARLNDWPSLEALNKVIDYGQPEAFMKEQIHLERVIVAETDNEILGYALWQIMWGNTPLLALVKVFPEHQQKGAGSALIDEFEKRIAGEGFKNYMSSTMADNSLGKTFHTKQGFSDIGMLNMHYGDEIFYKKDL